MICNNGTPDPSGIAVDIKGPPSQFFLGGCVYSQLNMGPMAYLREKYQEFTAKFNYFYLIPLFGFLCWYTLFLGLIGLWYARGSPIYPQYEQTVRPLPLERIGAIVSPVFFNIFIFIHVVTFCLSMYLEYYHRRIGKLIKFAKPKVQTLLANWSLAVGILAQLFFIIQSIVGTVLIQRGRRADTHYAVLLAVFGILVMISLALNFVNYYIMGQYYRNYVNGEVWNKFMISFVCKVVWWLTSLTLAVTTCIFYVKGNLKVSLIFEWTFHLWYGLLLAFWTYDLYPITEMRALREKANNTRLKRLHVMNKLLWSKKVAVRDSIIEADSILDDFEFETTPFAHLPYSMPHG